METGFLNPIQDEEHFSMPFYNQAEGLDDNDHMLFNEMIVPEVIDYDNLWHAVDDVEEPSSQQTDGEGQKEDFQKMLFEWQHQLTCMQEPEVIKKIVPVAEETAKEVSEMFVSEPSTMTTASDPCIDELFPPESSRDPLSVDFEVTKKEDFNRLEIKPKINSHKIDKHTTKLKNRTKKNLEEKITLKIETENDAVSVKLEKLSPNTLLMEGQPTIVSVKEIHAKADKELTINENEVVTAVNVDTVSSEEQPMLLAGDLNSLLEQFEATEQVNVATPAVSSSPSPPRPTNQTIRDALPVEVINRIKASRENHKKMIPVIPAMPSKRPGRGATRMQDAGATLSRNKLLKLVTGGAGGETVQLDHAYCNSGGESTSSSSRSFYMSDSSEYPSQSSTPDTSYSRAPDYCPTSHKKKEPSRVPDTGSRKDSGLESGENSDEEVPAAKLKNSEVAKIANTVKEINAAIKRNKVPTVSLLKKNNIKVEKEVDASAISNVSECLSPAVVEREEPEAGKKKKKLNLEEYRVRRVERERIRSQESSRANSPVSCATSTAQADSTTSTNEGAKEKPLMHSVEVQTQTCDFIDLTAPNSPKETDKSRKERKEKRNDLNHRSYRSRRGRSSSSSSSGSDRHHRRKRNSRRRSRQRRNSVSRMWSRSRSRSRSYSLDSSRSRSRSRSRDRRQRWRSRSRSPRRSGNHYRHLSIGSSHRRDRERNNSRDRRSNRSGSRSSRAPEFGTQEKNRQVEERRVIYVGRIDEGTTKADLRRRFSQFGPIVDISVHFRERGDNYGFVTFAYNQDAYKAVEHGNDDPTQPHYDLCFGGRRAFCKQRYADLDGMASTSVHDQYRSPIAPQRPHNESFDLLLNEMKATLCKRPSV